MSTAINMNKVIIAGLFDKVISSVSEARKLFVGKEIGEPELKRINSEPIRYTNGEALPKGIEAHIIALINGLS
jgi:hypothetical protein